MLTFEVREFYRMPYVGPGICMVGVDLHDETASLSALEGNPVILKYKDRTTHTVIQRVSPPHPDHLPPYRIGERIGITVKIEGA